MNIYMIDINHVVGSDYEGMELKYTVASSMGSAIVRAENYIATQYGSLDYSVINKIELLSTLTNAEIDTIRHELR